MDLKKFSSNFTDLAVSPSFPFYGSESLAVSIFFHQAVLDWRILDIFGGLKRLEFLISLFERLRVWMSRTRVWDTEVSEVSLARKEKL